MLTLEYYEDVQKLVIEKVEILQKGFLSTQWVNGPRLQRWILWARSCKSRMPWPRTDAVFPFSAKHGRVRKNQYVPNKLVNFHRQKSAIGKRHGFQNGFYIFQVRLCEDYTAKVDLYLRDAGKAYPALSTCVARELTQTSEATCQQQFVFLVFCLPQKIRTKRLHFQGPSSERIVIERPKVSLHGIESRRQHTGWPCGYDRSVSL